jgi:hypothetical protein
VAALADVADAFKGQCHLAHQAEALAHRGAPGCAVRMGRGPPRMVGSARRGADTPYRAYLPRRSAAHERPPRAGFSASWCARRGWRATAASQSCCMLFGPSHECST